MIIISYERIYFMNKDFGLIHVYFGDGKGKTTSATGLAVRAAGSDNKVLINRYLKNPDSGELNILNKIENIDITGSEEDFGFSFNMTEKEKKKASEFFTNQLITAFADAAKYDLLILDEINVAVSLGYIDEELLIKLLTQKPTHLEVVLTGRNPTEKILSMADYASEIKEIKHPYKKGVPARTGIEK